MAAGTNDFQLRFGYWIVSHKQTLRTWWALSLMAVMLVSLLWMLAFFTIFFSQENSTSAAVIRTANGMGSFLAQSYRPQSLRIGEVTVIPRDAKHVDVVADVTNPNQAWGAQTVTAHFVIDGVAAPSQQLFVNQGSQRPVMQLNTTATMPATASATLVIDSVSWARALTAGLPEPKFLIEHQNVENSSVDSSGQATSTITADVTNQSVYNFYHVDVAVVLKIADRIIGVTTVGMDHWPTLTARALSVTVPYAIQTGVTILIEPQVSRFDVGNTYR